MTPPDLRRLDTRLMGGDDEALGEAYGLIQHRLAQTVRLRMDRRMIGRVDPDDIVQESFLAASRRLDDYRRKAPASLFIWLRTITLQVLIDASRFHLRSKRRSRTLEVPLLPGNGSTSVSGLPGDLTSPTGAAERRELNDKLQETLDCMSELDREILILRHFEELTNNEVADVLGIHKAAATNRYLRALRRLKQRLSTYPDLREQAGA